MSFVGFGMANTDDYPGPRIIGQGGRRIGGWIWVAPGIPQPGPAELLEPVALALEGSDSGATDQNGPKSRPNLMVQEVPVGSSPAEGSPSLDAIEHEGPRVRIKVVGPVEVEPWLKVPTRSKATEAACVLAVHRRRPLTIEELQIALSSDDDGQETSAKSVRTYMSDLRWSLGSIHVPSARGSGYRLADSVTCDWDEIQELAALRPADIDGQIRALGDALNLVRGRPFEGTRYKWVDAELLVSEMEVAIGDIARRLGKIARAHDGMQGILWSAGRRAVLACPYDVGLWEMALEGAAGYDPVELARTWHDAQVTLGDEAAALHDLAQRLGLL
jgi:hypothetical protein